LSPLYLPLPKSFGSSFMNKSTTHDNLNKDASSKTSADLNTSQTERNAVLEFLNQFPSSSQAATITSSLQASHSEGTIFENKDMTIEADEAVEEDLDDLAELLRQLDEATGVASGIEGRLDGILEDLETQLTRLEGRGESVTTTSPASAAGPLSKKTA